MTLRRESKNPRRRRVENRVQGREMPKSQQWDVECLGSKMVSATIIVKGPAELAGTENRPAQENNRQV